MAGSLVPAFACSTRRSPLYTCTRHLITNQAGEPLTPPLHFRRQPRIKLPTRPCPQPGSRARLRRPLQTRMVFQRRLHHRWRGIHSLPPHHTQSPSELYQAIVRSGSFRPSARNEHLYSYCHFTGFTVGQRRSRYAIRAGRNLPTKEFRYLRMVIVTAVCWGLNSASHPQGVVTVVPLIPAPGRRQCAYTSPYGFARTCVFKQSPPYSLRPPQPHPRNGAGSQGSPYPEVTEECRVP